MRLINVIGGFVLSFMVMVTFGAEAAYLPDAEFMAKMERLVRLAETQVFGPAKFRAVQAGRPYREGEVAYFVVSTEKGPFLHLEEWISLPDGFRVIMTEIFPSRAVRWTVPIPPKTLDTDHRDSGISLEETMDINSAEAIRASEKAQELLRREGVPAFFSGVEM